MDLTKKEDKNVGTSALYTMGNKIIKGVRRSRLDGRKREGRGKRRQEQGLDWTEEKYR